MNQYRHYKTQTQSAFSLSEVLLILFVVLFLGLILFFIINPQKNFAESRNTERLIDVTDLANAINLYVNDNGSLGKVEDQIPTCPQTAKISKNEVNLQNLVDEGYITELPKDPQTGTSEDTGYVICKNTSGRFTVSAPNAENETEIYFKK
ncbi:MAG: hypothetical protein KatS3mg085_527 [Candidatus Dojkabacteria bacterium]|nr:MAG: hypothetical protein KatS3mg085_527 [Candidatus Dojkabacteria bacterium]